MDPQWWITHPSWESPWSNGSHWSHCSIPSSGPVLPLWPLCPLWSPTTISSISSSRRIILGPLGDPLHHPLYFLCYYSISTVSPYWLKPDYWRLLIQFLHQYHPPHFPPHLTHHLFYHLGDLPYLVVEFLPHPWSHAPIECGKADPVTPDLVGIFLFWVSFLEGPGPDFGPLSCGPPSSKERSLIRWHLLWDFISLPLLWLLVFF